MDICYYGDKITNHIAKTPEGFLICQDVPISRTGYQTYLSSEMFDSPKDGHRAIPVYRPAEEVFDPKSLASFEGKPVTNEHPDEDVTPDNYTRYSCGHVQNVHVGSGEDSNKVLADLYITDPHLIELIQHGKREISCGYYAEERRDKAGRICQTRIRGNHVAVVKNGRAGKNVCIRDRDPFKGKDMVRDYGVKGMKKGVHKAVEKVGNAVKSAAGKAGSAISSAANKAAGTRVGRTALAVGRAAGNTLPGRAVKKVGGGIAKIGKAYGKAAGNRLKGAVQKSGKGLAFIAKHAPITHQLKATAKVAGYAGNRVKKILGKDSFDDMYLDYGVPGMKKGVHKAKEIAGRIANEAKGLGRQIEGTVQGSLAKRYVKGKAKGIVKGAGRIANSSARALKGLAKINTLPARLAIKGATTVGKKVAGSSPVRAGIKAWKGQDSWSYDNLLGGNKMRRKRYLYDEEPFVDEDELLDEDYLADEDEFADDEVVAKEEEFVDEDEFTDEDDFEDDDYLEDEDNFEDEDEFVDEDIEDADDFEDDDYLEDEDDFEDDDYLEDEDDFEDADDFEDDDEVSDDEANAAIVDVCKDAKRTLRDARRSLRKSMSIVKRAQRDAMILNDDDLEDEDLDDADLIQSDADLHDDDYLADDDDEFMDDDFDGSDISDADIESELEDDDYELMDSDDFEDGDEMACDKCDEDPIEDDEDVEVTEASESDVIDEDKTRALREITEASRGITDPNERKSLQDAIYKALCKKTQMPGLMNTTKKYRSKMDSASNKNKVSVADQQSIYDSFNPHKKTSF